MYDNQAGLIDYFPLHHAVDYRKMDIKGLTLELKKLNASMNEAAEVFKITGDMECSKAVKRISNKRRVVKHCLAELQGGSDLDAMKQKFAELKDKLEKSEEKSTRLGKLVYSQNQYIGELKRKLASK